ncbi:NADPH-dependent 7-cyano-7-deazaguanine reductase QueF [bacterium]|nr:NADPH-dependent 7-cyano-7-deazaguanine reductase QueF [candidate division CSSED10-310 bacterium]
MKPEKDLKLSWNTPEAIRTDLLDTFPYEGESQHITYSTKEFSAVCPFSGLPDLAEIIVEYYPDNLCLELKSLKLYLVSFRNVGMYQETITDRIFRDLWKTLTPRWLKIRTIYATRGGIDAICVIEKGTQPSALR